MTGALATLAVRAQDGDAASADDLLVHLVADGHRLAYAMVQDVHAADDLVQEACIKAWRKLHQLRRGADPVPWFLGIVANECRSFHRSRWVRTVSSMGTVPTRSSGAADTDGDVSIRAALAQLSRDDRLVLVLRYYLDMSAEQSAAVLRISPGGVRSRAHRAARRLRALIGETGGG